MKEADPAVMGELQALKAEVKKIWSQSPNQNQQKKGTSRSDSGRKKRDKNFVKDCPSPARDLNSQWGERRRPSPPAATTKKEVSTCTMDQNPES